MAELFNIRSLPIFKVFVVVVFARSLSALKVPSTITLPSKVSVTFELKSETPTEPEEVVPAPVYIRVAATFAELSVIVILSFGRMCPSEAAEIVAAATACAAESIKETEAWPFHSAKEAATVDVIFELVLSSKINTPPSRDAFIDFEKLIKGAVIVIPVALSIIGTDKEPVLILRPEAMADPDCKVI